MTEENIQENMEQTVHTIRDDTKPMEVAADPMSELKGETDTSTRSFFIALAILGFVLIGVFMMPRLFPDQGPQTLNEIQGMVVAEGLDTETAYTYNGYGFVYYDDLWYTQILDQFSGDLYDVPLHFGPRDLTDVMVAGDLNAFFVGVTQGDIEGNIGRYYLTFDPNGEDMGYVALAAGELSQNLVTTFNMAPVSACSAEGTGCEEIPIITCDNTEDPVIYLMSGESAAVYAADNCIVIQGDKEELVRSVDRFLLKLYNIMV
jgi:hypothetical protein